MKLTFQNKMKCDFNFVLITNLTKSHIDQNDPMSIIFNVRRV